MFKRVINAVIGTRHERERKKIQPIVDEINEHYARLQNVSDEELRGQTAKFREIIRERTGRARGARRRAQGAEAHGERSGRARSHRHRAERRRRPRRRRGRAAPGDRRGARRDPARGVRHGARRRAPPASARRSWSPAASWRGTWCHYDVQLMGGIQLHLGKIAEMATGEGKTLVATLPLYLNALPGKGAHLVTVNSYLARRDSQWMGHLYNYLGLTVGCLDDTEPGSPERRAAYLRRHHVRHEQRVRLRLSARQHGRVARPARAARRTSTRSSTKWTRCSSTKRERRSSSRVRSATRTTGCTSSTTPPSRGSCDARRSWSTRSSAKRERDLEKGDTRRRRPQAVQGAARQPEEPSPDEGAAGAGQQAARAEDGARAHRRSPAAGRASRRTATSKKTCSSCSTRRDTRCISPTRASTSCRRTSTTRSCCPTCRRRCIASITTTT